MTPLTPTIWVRTVSPSRGTQRPWGAALSTIAPNSGAWREPGVAHGRVGLGTELDAFVVGQALLFSLLFLPVVFVLRR